MRNKNISLTLLATLALSFPLAGCGSKTSESDNNQVTPNESVQNSLPNVNSSESYSSVLTEFKNFANDYNQAAAEGKLMDENKYITEPWVNMSTMSINSDGYGYALKDLNGNGSEELILLTKSDDTEEGDYVISAIYSLVDGKPHLLDSFYGRYRCYIGEDGFIYRSGSYSAWDESYEKCAINTAGTAMEVIEKIEADSYDEKTGERMQDSKGEVIVKYYQSHEGAQRSEISKQQFDEIVNQMPQNNKQSGLNFISLT